MEQPTQAAEARSCWRVVIRGQSASCCAQAARLLPLPHLLHCPSPKIAHPTKCPTLQRPTGPRAWRAQPAAARAAPPVRAASAAQSCGRAGARSKPQPCAPSSAPACIAPASTPPPRKLACASASPKPPPLPHDSLHTGNKALRDPERGVRDDNHQRITWRRSSTFKLNASTALRTLS